MKYRFITAIFNLKLENLKNKGIEIFPGARISNGNNILANTLGTNLMQFTAGIHSIDEFKDSTYIYIDGELNDIHTKEQIDEIGTEYTFFFLREVQSFIHCLWKIKDNNVYVRDGFLLAYNNHFEDGCTFKASLSEIFSYSNLENTDSVFTDSEISDAISKFYPLTFDSYSEENFGGKNPNSNHLFKSKGTERMLRAYYFTLVARKSAIAPMKILSYCNALECLFTIGTAEVNHKIAERVAILLGTSNESKLKLFKVIKNAYNNRSQIVHGQYLKGTEESLLPLSKELDKILRQLIVDDHDIFSKKDSEMEDFFTNLLFTNSSSI